MRRDRKNPTNVDSEGQSWKAGTTVLPGGGFKGMKGRQMTEKEREHSLPFSIIMVAGKLPSVSGFSGLNITLPLFLRCLLMEELIEGHFHFFREYCKHKKYPTSDENQSSKPTYWVPAWVSTFAIGPSPFLAMMRLGLFIYKHWLVRKHWNRILLNSYYFTLKKFCSLLNHKGRDTNKCKMLHIFN